MLLVSLTGQGRLPDTTVHTLEISETLEYAGVGRDGMDPSGFFSPIGGLLCGLPRPVSQ